MLQNMFVGVLSSTLLDPAVIALGHAIIAFFNFTNVTVCHLYVRFYNFNFLEFLQLSLS